MKKLYIYIYIYIYIIEGDIIFYEISNFVQILGTFRENLKIPSLTSLGILRFYRKKV